MRRRQNFAERARPGGHAHEGESEARQENRRQKKEHRHLHCLQLVLCNRRECVANGKIGDDVDDEAHREQSQRTDHRNVEDEACDQKNDRALDRADQDVRRDLADHDLERSRRHGEEIFVGAAFALASERKAGHQHHGHRQDDGEQPRNDVVLCDRFRIVQKMCHRIEGRWPLSAVGQWADEIVAQRRACEIEKGRHCITAHSGICRVPFDQEVRLRATHDIAGEVHRNFHHEDDAAFLQQAPRRFGIFRFRNDVKIARVFERSDDGTRQGAGVTDRDRRGQIFGIQVDGKAEQEQLHHRHAKDHRKRQAIAPQLQEFLGEHGEEAAERERVHQAAALSCS